MKPITSFLSLLGLAVILILLGHGPQASPGPKNLSKLVPTASLTKTSSDVAKPRLADSDFGLAGNNASGKPQFARAARTSLPAAAQPAISTALGRDDSRYQVRAVLGGFRAENPQQPLTAEFRAQGIEVRSGTARWGLALDRYGYGDSLRAVSAAAPQASANRVEYRRGALTEWYVNGPVGLEQGFTVTERPGRSDRKPLTIALALSKNLTALVDPGGAGLTLTRSDTHAALRYTGLMAYDATGRELRSWLDVRGEQLLLRVEDSEARYPLVVDPFIQVAKLTASDGVPGDIFGAVFLSSDGSTLAIGAPSQPGFGKQGSAYVFEKPAGGWATTSTFAAKLTAPDGTGVNDQFGRSMAISSDGSTLVIGAGEAKIGANFNQGAAYVFVRPASGWATTSTFVAKLTTSDGAPGDFFGLTQIGVPSDGGTIVVGACHDRRFGGTTPGAAYVFEKPASGWATTSTFNAKLTASDGTQGSPVFGNDFCAVAMSSDGGTVVVGAVAATVGSNILQGAAYVFLRPSSGWVTTTETAKLTASDGAAGDEFGLPATDSNGDTILVGAPVATIGSNPQQGAAYVFAKPASGWATTSTFAAKLTASDGAAANFFGDEFSVAMTRDGGKVVVGATGSNSNRGAAYVFEKPTSGWATTSTFAAKLTASDGAANDNFGRYVTVNSDAQTVVVGAFGANANRGAAYVFEELPPADLVIFKGANESEVRSGGQLIYGIAVANLGPGNASEVVVHDQLPNGTTFISATATQGSCTFSSGALTCHLGNLNKFTFTNPGVFIKIVVHVTAAPGSTLTNTATVSAANPDPNPNNNSATTRTRVNGGRDRD